MNKFNVSMMKALAIGASASVLLACSSGSETGTGLLSLNITDAPIDGASKVMVQFSSVEVHGAESKTIAIDPPLQIDLLELTGSNSSALFSGVSLEAGNYQWIRLGVDTDGALDTYIELTDGNKHELEIPSGSTTGLKLSRGFTVPEGGSANFTIDFDLRKSIVFNNQGYKLKPSLRMVNNVEVGHVSGTTSLVSTDGCAVYVYEGHSAVLVDVSTGSDAVLTTGNVSLNANSGVYEYEIGFLETGDYTLALTCDNVNDNPEDVDDLTFLDNQNVTIEANKTAVINF